VVTSPGPTRSDERMIVRARSARPYQLPPGSRSDSGTRRSSSADSIGSSSPASVARQRLAASTVISTSAGVESASARSRSYSSLAEPPRSARSVPVSEAKSSNGCSSP
jgi:hypothetical protein